LQDLFVKLSELYANDRLQLSFEVFPPRTAQGLEPLYAAVGELRAYRPGFISCTYGAGGSTRDLTLEIVAGIRRRFAVPATAHLTCVGSTADQIRDYLRQATALEVENIMALRGDPPKGEEQFVAVAGGLTHANELVALIRAEFPHFGIGVAGYPEVHQEALDATSDLEFLKQKVDAGADAVFTQLFYDNADFLAFRDRCTATSIKVPIVPGLLPIQSYAQIKRITSLCKAKLPEMLVSRLERFRDDGDAQIEVGIEHASDQCRGLLAAGVPGFHFYVLNKSGPTCRILANILPGQKNPTLDVCEDLKSEI
jgi:methylenetetrahydrofolate reductase (NADPH)